MEGKSLWQTIAQEVERQRLADEVPAFGLEEVQDSPDRLGGAGGVHRAEDQVAGLAGLEGGLEGLSVAPLADEHHVGVLAHEVFQGRLEALDVDADLALADEGLLVLEDVLDGVLDGHNVTGASVVDVLDHGGDGGAFAAAGGA